VGDDIAWMKFGEDGRLYAINPEAGFFGVAPGTGAHTNPNAMASLDANCIFTNVAYTKEGDVWWEGMTKEVPEGLTDWKGQPYEYKGKDSPPAAHPNSRFTAPAKQCPIASPEMESAVGVPIDAIIFGGRRSDTVPLIYQSLDWAHGTYLGATMTSEPTAAAADASKALRRDPFAMLPFCGYNMADYWAHWLSMTSRTDESKLPSIFFVNWFKTRSGTNDKSFLWPGFGDNSRVLEWIFDRTEAEPSLPTTETPIGYIPDWKKGGLNLEGAGVSDDDMENLFDIKPEVWRAELERNAEYFKKAGDKMPEGLLAVHAKLEKRLQ
jgi:phosphoenolpyruvate carboxykinase (GTP)